MVKYIQSCPLYLRFEKNDILIFSQLVHFSGMRLVAPSEEVLNLYLQLTWSRSQAELVSLFTQNVEKSCKETILL